jgi:hypothetical protein
MVLKTMIQLLPSNDEKLRLIFRALLCEERDNFHFAKKRRGTTAMGLLDWDSTQMTSRNPLAETVSLFWMPLQRQGD